MYKYSKANPSQYVVDVGMQNRIVADSWTLKNLKISRIIVHSSFDWNSFLQDIALVKLDVILIFFFTFFVLLIIVNYMKTIN